MANDEPGLLPHYSLTGFTGMCPTCHGDLVNVTTVMDLRPQYLCVGEGRHRWERLSFNEMYPDMPTPRQRALMDWVRIFAYEIHAIQHLCTTRPMYDRHVRGAIGAADYLAYVASREYPNPRYRRNSENSNELPK